MFGISRRFFSFIKTINFEYESALLSTVCQTFAGMASMNAYLDKCYEHLECDEYPPGCYIRIDRSHYVATILRNKQLGKVFGTQRDRKNFYIRMIGFLLQQSDWKLIKDIMKDAFRLAIDPNPNPAVCMMQSKLVDITKNHKIYKVDETETIDDPKKTLFDARWNVKMSAFRYLRPTV